MQVSTTFLGSRLTDQRNMSMAHSPCPSILLHGREQHPRAYPTFTYPMMIPETLHMRTFKVVSPYKPMFKYQEESGPMVGDLLDGPHGTHPNLTEPVLSTIRHKQARDQESMNLQEGFPSTTSRNTSRSEHTLDQDGDTSDISPAVLDLVLNGSIDVLPPHFSSGRTGPWLSSPDDEWPVAVSPLRAEGGTIRGALAAIPIPQGTELGPLLPQRPVLSTDKEFSTFNQFLWEVYDTEGGLTHYVQALGWMAHVGVAPNDSIQNLEVIQRGTHIYYKALRNIGQGETLLVWYSPSQTSFLGVSLPSEQSATLLPNKTRLGRNDNKPQMPTSRAISNDKGGHLRCTVCNRGFNSRSNLRSHMRTHTLHRPFKCSFCDRGFSQSSTLRNHIRLHTGEKPYKCLVCESSYSQLAGLRAHQKSARHRPKLPAISATSAIS